MQKKLRLPICDALYRVLNKEVSPQQCLEELVGNKGEPRDTFARVDLFSRVE